MTPRTLKEKSTGRYVYYIKKVPHTKNTYEYRLTNNPHAILESDIAKIINIKDFEICDFAYKWEGNVIRTKNKTNKRLSQVYLVRHERKPTIVRSVLKLICTKKVNMYLLEKCESAENYNSYIDHNIKDCLTETEFKAIKRTGEKYGWKK